MSKMKMIGFTAEASFYGMSESYYMYGTHATLINNREVIPSFYCSCDYVPGIGEVCYCHTHHDIE